MDNDMRVKLTKYMDDIRVKIEERIDEIVEKYEFGEMMAPIRYAVTGAAGGKKLRPTVATLLSQALGGKNDSNTLEVAVIVEMIHQGSIVIDDMLDGDTERRGKPSLFMAETLGNTMMGSFVMFLIANKIGAHRVPKAKDLVMDVVDKLAKGNVVEMLSKSWKEEDYNKMIYYKTAYLYEAAARFGAIMADAHDDVIQVAADYGKNIGMLYQVTDDLVDVLKSRNAGTPLGDMRRGKITLTMIRMYDCAGDKNPGIKQFLERYSKKQMLPEELTAFFQDCSRFKAIDYVQEIIAKYRSNAIASAGCLPDNEYTQMLTCLPDYMIDALMAEVK